MPDYTIVYVDAGHLNSGPYTFSTGAILTTPPYCEMWGLVNPTNEGLGLDLPGLNSGPYTFSAGAILTSTSIF